MPREFWIAKDAEGRFWECTLSKTKRMAINQLEYVTEDSWRTLKKYGHTVVKVTLKEVRRADC